MDCTRDARGVNKDSAAGLARIEAIRDAAITRAALGQAAHHELLPDGRHQVRLFDRSAGIMREWSGDTLDDAIAAARAGKGQG